MKLGYAMSLSSEGSHAASAKAIEVVAIILDLAFPPPGDRNALFWKKVKGADKRDSQVPKDDRGLSAETTIPLSLLHTYYDGILKTHGYDLSKVPEKQLRTMADFYVRIALAGRTNSSINMLSGTIVLPKSRRSWMDVKVGEEVAFRLYGTKPAHLAAVDTEMDKAGRRSASDSKRRGKGISATALVRIRRPNPHPKHKRLDYWAIVGEYMARVAEGQKTHPSPQHQVQFDDRTGQAGGLRMLSVPKLFVSITTSTRYAGQDVQPATMNNLINADLVLSGAVSENRREKSLHIRHTIVSCAIRYAAITMVGRSNLPSQQIRTLLGELYARSMHSQQTSESRYSLAACDQHHTSIPILDARLTFDNFILYI